MPVRKLKPTTAPRRHMVEVYHPHLSKVEPHEPLLSRLNRKSGRNNLGRITCRHKGGGARRMYRQIDFVRTGKAGVPAVVETIEYDPNRTAHIALLKFADGDRRYIVAPRKLRVGDKVAANDGNTKDFGITEGNSLKIKDIPVGTMLHCVELKPGKGAQIARSAGTGVQLLGKDSRHAILRLPSGEMRKVPVECTATIGVVSNSEHNLKKLGKAGRSRHLGRRPTVRGVAMNPVDHALGGGEGRTSGGRPSCGPKGSPKKGQKTRRNKLTNDMIIRRRGNKK